jgi:hypothetical protein
VGPFDFQSSGMAVRSCEPQPPAGNALDRSPVTS